jgi:CBS domain-containing protein
VTDFLRVRLFNVLFHKPWLKGVIASGHTVIPGTSFAPLLMWNGKSLAKEETMKLLQLKMKARDVMNTRVMAATRRAVGRDLALQLLGGMYSGLPVVDERDGQIIGVVTEFDLLKAVQDGKDLQSVKAQDIMNLIPITVDEDATVEEVIEKMIDCQVIRIPVVKKGKLVGIIARADLLCQFVEPEFVRFPQNDVLSKPTPA